MAAQASEPWRLILFSFLPSRFQICTQGIINGPVGCQVHVIQGDLFCDGV